MKQDALQRMLDFLSLLRSKNIHYRMERQSPEALMLTFSLSTICIEVEFFIDQVWFSYFKGDQLQQGDEKSLLALIGENWDG